MKTGNQGNRKPGRNLRIPNFLFRFPHTTSRLPPTSLASLGLALGLTAVLTGASAPPPPLLWPLPIHEGCTSSFGEYRRTHFHGGVDMRTHQEEGWPCVAPADGKVVRVRREPGGYGRVLYLQLDDGRTVVYGHVCRFENKRLHLDDKLLEACRRAGTSFPGDVVVEPPAPVRAGDVVCYSGELGVGPPHLHYEIRRGDDQCDPFSEGLPMPAGVEPPHIVGVAFEPQDATGTVDGGFAPVFVPADRGDGGVRLARQVTLSGAVDLYLVAAGNLGVAGNTTGIPMIDASLDGAPFFHMDMRCVSLARFKQSPALFQPAYDRNGATAYRLRRLPWLQFSDIEGAGLAPGLASGPHALKVIASNRADQSTVLTGTLTVDNREPARQRALPGTGFTLQSVQPTPAGLLLALTRQAQAGETEVRVGARAIRNLRVEVNGNGRVQALLPREELPREGGALSIGGGTSSWFAGAGPGQVDVGGVRLTLPEGAVGAARPEPGAARYPGTAAYLDVAPYALQSQASVEFPGFAPRARVGVYGSGGGLFLDNWTGKRVPFFAEGVYCLREDDSAPRWGRPSVVRIPRAGAMDLRLPLTDQGTGPSLRSLRLTLDGRPAFADWDPDTHTVRVDLDGTAPGRHTIAGSCKDWAGNAGVLAPASFVLK